MRISASQWQHVSDISCLCNNNIKNQGNVIWKKFTVFIIRDAAADDDIMCKNWVDAWMCFFQLETSKVIHVVLVRSVFLFSCWCFTINYIFLLLKLKLTQTYQINAKKKESNLFFSLCFSSSFIFSEYVNKAVLFAGCINICCHTVETVHFSKKRQFSPQNSSAS